MPRTTFPPKEWPIRAWGKSFKLRSKERISDAAECTVFGPCWLDDESVTESPWHLRSTKRICQDGNPWDIIEADWVKHIYAGLVRSTWHGACSHAWEEVYIRYLQKHSCKGLRGWKDWSLLLSAISSCQMVVVIVHLLMIRQNSAWNISGELADYRLLAHLHVSPWTQYAMD